MALYSLIVLMYH